MSRTYHHGINWRKQRHDNWCSNEPKWWRKAFKHRPQRAATREAIGLVMKGNEDALFPLDKKPWIYYW